MVLTTSSPRSPRKWEDLPIRRRLDQARGDTLFKSPITDGDLTQPQASVSPVQDLQPHLSKKLKMSES